MEKLINDMVVLIVTKQDVSKIIRKTNSKGQTRVMSHCRQNMRTP